MNQKHYMNYSRYELCEALDTPLFDEIGEAAINESGETFVLLNHWSIYNFYAAQGIYPIAESKYWLLYECGAVQGEDEGFGIMMEADCIPFEGYSDTYEKLMHNFTTGCDSIADVLVRITRWIHLA